MTWQNFCKPPKPLSCGCRHCARLACIAREYVWTWELNPNAKDIAINKQLWTMHFPVLGNVAPGTDMFAPDGAPTSWKHVRDGFCTERPRGSKGDYENAQCKTGRGHSGVDIFPALAQAGQNPAIAARGGQVTLAKCLGGAGNTVIIDADDGRRYLYEHLHSRSVNLNQWVKAGQMLGTVGGSNNSSCGGSDAVHLHFDVREGGVSRENHAIDSYRNLRYNYAWIGRDKWGAKYDSAFTSAIVNGNQYYSTLYAKLTNVGWPSRSSMGQPNVASTRSSSGASGRKQYTSIPLARYSSDFRSGVIIKRDGSSAAYFVPRTVLVAYVKAGEESGFLGFPVSHFEPGKQFFEGGCIFHNGSKFVAGDHSLSICKRPYQ